MTVMVAHPIHAATGPKLLALPPPADGGSMPTEETEEPDSENEDELCDNTGHCSLPQVERPGWRRGSFLPVAHTEGREKRGLGWTKDNKKSKKARGAKAQDEDDDDDNETPGDSKLQTRMQHFFEEVEELFLLKNHELKQAEFTLQKVKDAIKEHSGVAVRKPADLTDETRVAWDQRVSFRILTWQAFRHELESRLAENRANTLQDDDDTERAVRTLLICCNTVLENVVGMRLIKHPQYDNDAEDGDEDDEENIALLIHEIRRTLTWGNPADPDYNYKNIVGGLHSLQLRYRDLRHNRGLSRTKKSPPELSRDARDQWYGDTHFRRMNRLRHWSDLLAKMEQRPNADPRQIEAVNFVIKNLDATAIQFQSGVDHHNAIEQDLHFQRLQLLYSEAVWSGHFTPQQLMQIRRGIAGYSGQCVWEPTDTDKEWWFDVKQKRTRIETWRDMRREFTAYTQEDDDNYREHLYTLWEVWEVANSDAGVALEPAYKQQPRATVSDRHTVLLLEYELRHLLKLKPQNNTLARDLFRALDVTEREFYRLAQQAVPTRTSHVYDTWFVRPWAERRAFWIQVAQQNKPSVSVSESHALLANGIDAVIHMLDAIDTEQQNKQAAAETQGIHEKKVKSKLVSIREDDEDSDMFQFDSPAAARSSDHTGIVVPELTLPAAASSVSLVSHRAPTPPVVLSNEKADEEIATMVRSGYHTMLQILTEELGRAVKRSVHGAREALQAVGLPTELQMSQFAAFDNSWFERVCTPSRRVYWIQWQARLHTARDSANTPRHLVDRLTCLHSAIANILTLPNIVHTANANTKILELLRWNRNVRPLPAFTDAVIVKEHKQHHIPLPEGEDLNNIVGFAILELRTRLAQPKLRGGSDTDTKTRDSLDTLETFYQERTNASFDDHQSRFLSEHWFDHSHDAERVAYWASAVQVLKSLLALTHGSTMRATIEGLLLLIENVNENVLIKADQTDQTVAICALKELEMIEQCQAPADRAATRELILSLHNDILPTLLGSAHDVESVNKRDWTALSTNQRYFFFQEWVTAGYDKAYSSVRVSLQPIVREVMEWLNNGNRDETGDEKVPQMSRISTALFRLFHEIHNAERWHVHGIDDFRTSTLSDLHATLQKAVNNIDNANLRHADSIFCTEWFSTTNVGNRKSYWEFVLKHLHSWEKELQEHKIGDLGTVPELEKMVQFVIRSVRDIRYVAARLPSESPVLSVTPPLPTPPETIPVPPSPVVPRVQSPSTLIQRLTNIAVDDDEEMAPVAASSGGQGDGDEEMAPAPVSRASPVPATPPARPVSPVPVTPPVHRHSPAKMLSIADDEADQPSFDGVGAGDDDRRPDVIDLSDDTEPVQSLSAAPRVRNVINLIDDMPPRAAEGKSAVGPGGLPSWIGRPRVVSTDPAGRVLPSNINARQRFDNFSQEIAGFNVRPAAQPRPSARERAKAAAEAKAAEDAKSKADRFYALIRTLPGRANADPRARQAAERKAAQYIEDDIDTDTEDSVAETAAAASSSAGPAIASVANNRPSESMASISSEPCGPQIEALACRVLDYLDAAGTERDGSLWNPAVVEMHRDLDMPVSQADKQRVAACNTVKQTLLRAATRLVEERAVQNGAAGIMEDLAGADKDVVNYVIQSLASDAAVARTRMSNTTADRTQLRLLVTQWLRNWLRTVRFGGARQ